ncbi:MAG: flagellar basal body-associated FliL family protein [Dongiaceae bacterium]
MSEAETPEAEAAPKKSRKKLLILVAAGLLLLGGGGAGGAYFLGFFGGAADSEVLAEGEHGVPEDVEAPVFHELPEMVVRLEGGLGPYLKLAATLDLASPDFQEKVKTIEPRLVDTLQVYLMGLTPGDIKDTAGLHHVREELLKRVNDLVPHSTRAVLFKTIILQ